MSVIERKTSIEAMPQILDPRVIRGAELLDAVLPGWEDEIDLDQFQLSKCGWCIGGHLGGAGRLTSYLDGLTRIGEAARVKGIHSPGHEEIGFFTHDGPDDFAAMEQDWRLAVLSRRGS